MCNNMRNIPHTETVKDIKFDEITNNRYNLPFGVASNKY